MRHFAGVATVCVLLAACGEGERARTEAIAGTPVPMDYARTFSVVARDGYRIVDIRASIVTWGEAAEGQEQHARIVLVPRDREPPSLIGDLAGATLVRTPVMRVATNYAPHEAIMTALDVDDRLVAVGGTSSYNDAIRDRVRAGTLRQIGYGWHSPPSLDALAASRPDVLFMALGDLDHAQHMQRVAALGIPVVPMFIESEPTYMGRVDYVRLVGLLTGREREADAYAEDVNRRVDRLRALAAQQPRKKILAAWFAGGDRWMVTMRNAEAELLSDANAEVLLRQADDARRDAANRVGTEVLLSEATDADCWIIRDTHSQPLNDVATLRRFRAWREGCLFASDGRSKERQNAFDIYETGMIRPDLMLADTIRMLHPALRTEPFVFLQPDRRTVRP